MLSHLVVNRVSAPTALSAVQASSTPFSSLYWTCLTVNSSATVPTLADGEAIVKVSSSSVNAIDIDLVEPICVNFGCLEGTLGAAESSRIQNCYVLQRRRPYRTSRLLQPSTPRALMSLPTLLPSRGQSLHWNRGVARSTRNELFGD